jgi:hypothetical protein
MISHANAHLPQHPNLFFKGQLCLKTAYLLGSIAGGAMLLTSNQPATGLSGEEATGRGWVHGSALYAVQH